MIIVLTRHAEAVEPADWDGPDRTRPLTPAGRARLLDASAHMRRLRLSADVLLTSPYDRAVQTAEVLAEQLHVLQSVPCPELSAGARLDAFLSLVRRYATEPSIWIVAHMPEISVFASRLTGAPTDIEKAFRPGESLAVECPIEEGIPAPGRVMWRRRLEDWPAASG